MCHQVLVGQPFDIVKVVCALPSLSMPICLNRTSRGCKRPQLGLIRGCSIVLVESSRTRAHSLSTRRASRSCFRVIWSHSRFHRGSQGTLTPLLGIGLCVSIQFAGSEYSKRLFSARNVASGIGDGPLTGTQYFASGVVAGLANSVVSGPVEHIRIRKSVLFRDDRRNLRSSI